jgi:hypothetical protein
VLRHRDAPLRSERVDHFQYHYPKRWWLGQEVNGLDCWLLKCKYAKNSKRLNSQSQNNHHVARQSLLSLGYWSKILWIWVANSPDKRKIHPMTKGKRMPKWILSNVSNQMASTQSSKPTQSSSILFIQKIKAVFVFGLSIAWKKPDTRSGFELGLFISKHLISKHHVGNAQLDAVQQQHLHLVYQSMRGQRPLPYHWYYRKRNHGTLFYPWF